MIYILLFILILIGNILGTFAFGKLIKTSNNNRGRDTNNTKDCPNSELVLGKNANPCKYCRGIDGVHYHRIDGKLYKRDNYKKSGVMCDLCKKYPIRDVKKGILTEEQATHVHIIQN